MSPIRPSHWQTSLTDSPSQVRGLPDREPVLAVRVVAWRMAGNWGCECVTVDAKGRLWLWRLEESKWVNWRGERHRSQTGKRSFIAGEPVNLMVPVYGPMPRTRLKPREDEHAVREAIEASVAD